MRMSCLGLVEEKRTEGNTVKDIKNLFGLKKKMTI